MPEKQKIKVKKKDEMSDKERLVSSLATVWIRENPGRAKRILDKLEEPESTDETKTLDEDDVLV